MIEEFNENGVSGLRLTDPENDRKMIDMWLRDLEKEKSYIETIERLEVRSQEQKIEANLHCNQSVRSFVTPDAVRIDINNAIKEIVYALFV